MLRLIAIFKLLKGLLLLAVGSGAVRLLHRDLADAVTAWMVRLHLDPDSRYLGRLLEAVGAMDERTLKRIAAGVFLYAALLLTEGVGLMLKQRWAEYFTVIVTASFIPVEVVEVVRRVTVVRIVVIGVNIAIVWYLIARLRSRAEAPLPSPNGRRGAAA